MNRRRFLSAISRDSLVAAVIAAAGQAIRFLSYQPPSASATVFAAGRPEDYRPDGLIYVEEARAYVGRDAQGLYALDAVCTHLGCLVGREDKGGFVCPCHNSRFDVAGQVLTGPAAQPLRPLRLWFDQERGLLFVDRAETVAPTARLAL
ncbi:MAG: QcrA and Rieske domain-containing protein [Anaerolineae bacterium]